MVDKIKLDLSDESLIHLLNFILSMSVEDRNNALQHHDTLSELLGGPPGAEGMTGVEMQLLLNDLSQALTGFLNNCSRSTDQAIKIAQIMANHLVKMDRSASISENDRAEIERALEAFKVVEEDGISLKDSFRFETEED